jgi:hypothetical protein
MSHFLDNLTFFKRKKEPFSDGHGIKTDENRRWEDAYRAALAARPHRALHPWRELHRLLFLEDLCQERPGHLGDPADRLSAHPPRPAQP